MHDDQLDVTLDFDENELLPAVAQDAETGEVLMLSVCLARRPRQDPEYRACSLLFSKS